MKRILKKLCKTFVAIGVLTVLYTVLRLNLGGVRTPVYLLGTILIVLMIILIWIPRRVLRKTSRENITEIQIFQVSTAVVTRRYTNPKDVDVIKTIQSLCEKVYEDFPYSNEAVLESAIKIVFEEENEYYELCFYQAKENPNWILTAWGKKKLYFQNAFQMTDEEKMYIDSLLY